MKKLVVLCVTVLLFIEFGLKNLLVSLIYFHITLESSLYNGLLLLWIVLVNLGLLISLIGIFFAKTWARNLFFLLITMCLSLNVGDYIASYFYDDLTQVSLSDVLEVLVFPVFSFWVVQYSDAKEFFNVK